MGRNKSCATVNGPGGNRSGGFNSGKIQNYIWPYCMILVHLIGGEPHEYEVGSEVSMKSNGKTILKSSLELQSSQFSPPAKSRTVPCILPLRGICDQVILGYMNKIDSTSCGLYMWLV